MAFDKDALLLKLYEMMTSMAEDESGMLPLTREEADFLLENITDDDLPVLIGIRERLREIVKKH